MCSSSANIVIESINKLKRYKRVKKKYAKTPNDKMLEAILQCDQKAQKIRGGSDYPKQLKSFFGINTIMET